VVSNGGPQVSLDRVVEALEIYLTGLTDVLSKRLEEGTYAMPFSESDEVRREITAQELGAQLSGIDLSQAKRRKRYRRDASGGA
jgi:hypothetical protein